jgi:hypothetical protein
MSYFLLISSFLIDHPNNIRWRAPHTFSFPSLLLRISWHFNHPIITLFSHTSKEKWKENCETQRACHCRMVYNVKNWFRLPVKRPNQLLFSAVFVWLRQLQCIWLIILKSHRGSATAEWFIFSGWQLPERFFLSFPLPPSHCSSSYSSAVGRPT